ncbi:MAG: chemotaxis protein CheA [Deltaproteobacteria bacterium]|nr:chemotaxis protein CheA [Deltaproteobacteria bacterium]MCL5276741.1 chemotaxis protein CheA [Deltaproteobacteria bacterium]
MEQNKATKEFVAESEELIDKIFKDIDEIDTARKKGKPNPDTINDLFRSAHSLKGISSMFGFKEITEASHRMEDLLDKVRLSKVPITDALIKTLYAAGDTLRTMISSETFGKGMDIGPMLQQLRDAETAKQEEQKDAIFEDILLTKDILAVLTEYEESRLRENIKDGNNLFKIAASFSLLSFDKELADLTNQLKSFGEIITTLPSTTEAREGEIKFDILLGTTAPEEHLTSSLDFKNIKLQNIRKQATAKGPEGPAAVKGVMDESASIKGIAQTVRVDISKLDYIMNIVGELVLSKTNLVKISESIRKSMGFTGVSVELAKTIKELERKLKELQLGVLEIRMIPLSQLFDKVTRTATRIAKGLNKEIELEFYGADTELDKLIIEELTDPMMHIIRNSIDHGIEPAEERLIAGKPAKGKIVIRAYQKGNHVLIEIEDDGRGISLSSVRKKAVEKGLLQPSAKPARDELFNMLFLPGFSTKSDVSEVSGRGVGLDVVKTNLRAVSGMIDVDTQEGKWSRFTLTLPVTLAIIQALLIEADGKRYAVPLNSINESLSVPSDEIRIVENKEVIKLRETVLPVVRLSKLFNFNTIGDKQEQGYYVIVVGSGEKWVGILADKFVGQQDVVIKPLGKLLKGVKGIAGAADIGSGEIVLVLDVSVFMEEAVRS